MHGRLLANAIPMNLNFKIYNERAILHVFKITPFTSNPDKITPFTSNPDNTILIYSPTPLDCARNSCAYTGK